MNPKNNKIFGIVSLLLFAIYTYDKVTNNTSMRISDWIGLASLLFMSANFLTEGFKSSFNK